MNKGKIILAKMGSALECQAMSTRNDLSKSNMHFISEKHDREEETWALESRSSRLTQFPNPQSHSFLNCKMGSASPSHTEL